MPEDTTQPLPVKIQNYPDIRECFCKIAVCLNDLANIEYLLRLAAAGAQEHRFMRGSNAKALRAALRTIQKTLPIMIAQFDEFATTAKAEGRFQGERFPEFARLLLDAAKPFERYAEYNPDPRSWWHWYAKTLAQEVAVIYSRAGQTAKFSYKESPAVLTVVRLLKLANITQEREQVFNVVKGGN